MRLEKKVWDSDFFGRDFYLLDLSSGLELDRLKSELDNLDANGVFGTECQLNIRNIEMMTHLEELGFRIVDSRMEFITHTYRGEKEIVAPVGNFRLFGPQDWEALSDITVKNFVDNDQFKSRYTNRDIFSREESLRYYLQWHRWVLDVSPDLFLSWVDGDKYVGFYSILRLADPQGIRPRYKVGLAAIDPDYRSHNGQNLMQAWLFRETQDSE